MFNPINISGDPENLITDGSFGTAGFRLNMEFCRGPNHFWDSGLHFANYSETILFNIDSQSGESDVVTNGFHGLSAHIGRGYRFRLRNSYNILTVSAGLTGTFVVVEQAYTGLPFEFEAYDRIALLSYEAKSTARVAPSIFLNVNKDFRITEGIFFSIDYRYNYGWKTMFSKEVKIDAQNPLESRNFNVDINGTSHVFEFGLKLLLGKNKDSSDGLLPRM